MYNVGCTGSVGCVGESLGVEMEEWGVKLVGKGRKPFFMICLCTKGRRGFDSSFHRKVKVKWVGKEGEEDWQELLFLARHVLVCSCGI